MSGILCAAAAVPDGRFRGRSISAGDEDAITLAVEAAEACLREVDSEEVGGLYFATTSSPLGRCSTASMVSRMVGLPAPTRAIDLGGGARCGMAALLAAADAVESGAIGKVLVIAAEGNASSGRSESGPLCHAAAACVVGESPGLAEIGVRASRTGHRMDVGHSHSVEAVPDGFPADPRVFDYVPTLAGALKLVFSRLRKGPPEFSRFLLDSPGGRVHLELAKELGITEEKAVLSPEELGLEPLGCVSPLLLLARGLEDAEPEDRLLLTSFGDGADALVLLVPEEPDGNRPSVSGVLQGGVELSTEEVQRRAEGSTAAAWVEEGEAALSGFQDPEGLVCGECGGVFALPLRVCPGCRTKDAFRRSPLGRRGLVYSMTDEHGAVAGERVAIAAVNLIGGGRVLVPVADVSPRPVEVGGEVDLVVRRVGRSREGPIYHLKARGSGEDE